MLFKIPQMRSNQTTVPSFKCPYHLKTIHIKSRLGWIYYLGFWMVIVPVICKVKCVQVHKTGQQRSVFQYHSNTEPFTNPTALDHPNSECYQYSSPSCTLNTQLKPFYTLQIVLYVHWILKVTVVSVSFHFTPLACIDGSRAVII